MVVFVLTGFSFATGGCLGQYSTPTFIPPTDPALRVGSGTAPGPAIAGPAGGTEGISQ